MVGAAVTHGRRQKVGMVPAAVVLLVLAVVVA